MVSLYGLEALGLGLWGLGSRDTLEAARPTSAKTVVYVECALQIGLMSGSDMMIRRASCKQYDRRCKWKKVVMEDKIQ